jgi:hypothetical protein
MEVGSRLSLRLRSGKDQGLGFAAWIFIGLLGASFGCDRYAKPLRPVPEQFEAQFLDGSALDGRVFSGQPWVLELWVPG